MLIQIYNLFSVFLLFRPASLQIWDEPDLLHFDVESTNPWPIRENLRTFPTFLPSFLARVRIRCFRKTTFTSSPSLRKSLYINGLSVKASLPYFLHPRLHRRFWRFMHYAYFMHYEVINGHSAGRGRGRGGKIRKAENEVNKG